MPLPLADLKRRLAANRERSEAARFAIARHLAGMSLDELRKTSPKVWTRLGADGVVELIRQSTALSHLVVAPQGGEPPAPPSPPKRLLARMRASIALWKAIEPLPWVVATALVKSAALATLIVLATPGARMFAEQQHWLYHDPRCRSLNRWTSQCHYIVESPMLSNAEAAKLLHIPEETLAKANWGDSEEFFLAGDDIWVPLRGPLDYYRW